MSELLEELLERCRQGRPNACDILVGRYARASRELAFAILQDEHLAEDAVQAAFFNAFEHLGRLRQDAAFPGWLRQIVRREAQRILRHRSERPCGPAPERTDKADSPPQRLQAKEMRRLVRQALRRLPPAARKTAQLHYIDEVPQADLARLLGVPRGTVKRRLHDARMGLRSMLLGYITEGRGEARPQTPPGQGLPL